MLLRCLPDMNFVAAMQAVGRLSTGALSVDTLNGNPLLFLPLGLLGRSREVTFGQRSVVERLALCWNALSGVPDAMATDIYSPESSVVLVMRDIQCSRAAQGGTEATIVLTALERACVPKPYPQLIVGRVCASWIPHPLFSYTLFEESTNSPIIDQAFTEVDARRLALCWNTMVELKENGVVALGAGLDLLCMLALARHSGRGPTLNIKDRDYETCVLGQLLISERIEGGGYVMANGMSSAAARLSRSCGNAAKRMLPQRSEPAWNIPPMPVEIC